VNVTNQRGQTPLHVAVRYGDSACVHYLLTNGRQAVARTRMLCCLSGAQRHIQDSDGNTVAHLLADTFNEDVYRDILFPPTTTDILDLTLMNNDGRVLSVCTLTDVRAGYTSLHLAVRRLKLALVECLLECGGPVSLGDRSSGRRPLHMAVEAHDIDMCSLLLKRSQTSAASQLAHRTKSGDTPLHTAVRHAHEPIVQLLIECGADPTVQCAGVATHDVAAADGMDEATDEGRHGQLWTFVNTCVRVQ